MPLNACPSVVASCVLALVVAGCSSPHSSNSTGSTLPADVAAYVSDRLSDLSIIPREDTLTELEANGLVIGSPFVLSGDFDANGLEDFALLTAVKDTGTLRLVAIHRQSNDVLIHYVVKNLPGITVKPGQKIGLYLTREGAGQKQDIEGTIVHLNQDGITFNVYEKAAEIFYFNSGRYDSIVPVD